MDLHSNLEIKGEKAEEIYNTIMNAKPNSKEKREKRLKDFSDKMKKKQRP